MQKKKKPKLQITELFMAKAGWDRCFHGTIQRNIDEEGNPYVFSKIKIYEGYILSRSEDQWKVGAMLDELVKMVLDLGLHSSSGVSFKNNDTELLLN